MLNYPEMTRIFDDLIRAAVGECSDEDFFLLTDRSEKLRLEKMEANNNAPGFGCGDNGDFIYIYQLLISLTLRRGELNKTKKLISCIEGIDTYSLFSVKSVTIMECLFYGDGEIISDTLENWNKYISSWDYTSSFNTLPFLGDPFYWVSVSGVYKTVPDFYSRICESYKGVMSWNIVSNHGNTAILSALEHGDEEFVKAMTEAGHQPDFELFASLMTDTRLLYRFAELYGCTADSIAEILKHFLSDDEIFYLINLLYFSGIDKDIRDSLPDISLMPKISDVSSMCFVDSSVSGFGSSNRSFGMNFSSFCTSVNAYDEAERDMMISAIFSENMTVRVGEYYHIKIIREIFSGTDIKVHYIIQPELLCFTASDYIKLMTADISFAPAEEGGLAQNIRHMLSLNSKRLYSAMLKKGVINKDNFEAALEYLAENSLIIGIREFNVHSEKFI